MDRDLHTIYYDIQFVMINGESIARLKQALQTHRRALEELESAVLAFEEAADGSVLDRPGSRDFELLSVPQVCEHLGMCKSWVYRRIHNQEIPSVRLGRSIKIKRSDLEQYLEEHPNTLPEGTAVRVRTNSSEAGATTPSAAAATPILSWATWELIASSAILETTTSTGETVSKVTTSSPVATDSMSVLRTHSTSSALAASRRL